MFWTAAGAVLVYAQMDGADLTRMIALQIGLGGPLAIEKLLAAAPEGEPRGAD